MCYMYMLCPCFAPRIPSASGSCLAPASAWPLGLSVHGPMTALAPPPSLPPWQVHFALKNRGDNPITCRASQCSFRVNSTRVDCATTHCECEKRDECKGEGRAQRVEGGRTKVG